MSNFAHKYFQGQLYTFEHLIRTKLEVDFTISGNFKKVPIYVTFGCHCFTEKFDSSIHKDQHKYKYKSEIRAFNVQRYECSKHLPKVIKTLVTGTVYKSDKSYTYVAQISIPELSASQPYSIFFSLEKIRSVDDLTLDLFIKSAYLSPLKSGKNSRNWRFKRLVGEISGLM